MISSKNLGIGESQTYFELTKEAKLSRIGDLNCDIFIDDLPEFLLEPMFPIRTKRILFDPKRRNIDLNDIEVVTSWFDALELAGSIWC